MKRIAILAPPGRIPDFALYPVRRNQRRLKERGYHIALLERASARRMRADILILNSKYFRKQWTQPEVVFDFLHRAKRLADKVIWMDDSDSTSVTHFEVLEVVDLYWKKQLLKDRNLYADELYGDRIFTDYYHREFGVEDDGVIVHSRPLDLKLADRVALSWHLGLGDMEGDILPGWRKAIRRRLPPRYDFTFTSPERNRPLDFMFRGSRNYGRNTVRFHREEMGKILDRLAREDNGLTTHEPGRVSIEAYRNNMRDARSVVSPFGWGELGVRDFECWLHGAALLKPDMSHMETWPDVFRPGETYYALNWDFSNVESAIVEIARNDELQMHLARQGQAAYQSMISPDGMEAFCDWFIQQAER